jgi:hypothetical protein
MLALSTLIIVYLLCASRYTSFFEYQKKSIVGAFEKAFPRLLTKHTMVPYLSSSETPSIVTEQDDEQLDSTSWKSTSNETPSIVTEQDDEQLDSTSWKSTSNETPSIVTEQDDEQLDSTSWKSTSLKIQKPPVLATSLFRRKKNSFKTQTLKGSKLRKPMVMASFEETINKESRNEQANVDDDLSLPEERAQDTEHQESHFLHIAADIEHQESSLLHNGDGDISLPEEEQPTQFSESEGPRTLESVALLLQDEEELANEEIQNPETEVAEGSFEASEDEASQTSEVDIDYPSLQKEGGSTEVSEEGEHHTSESNAVIREELIEASEDEESQPSEADEDGYLSLQEEEESTEDIQEKDPQNSEVNMDDDLHQEEEELTQVSEDEASQSSDLDVDGDLLSEVEEEPTHELLKIDSDGITQVEEDRLELFQNEVSQNLQSDFDSDLSLKAEEELAQVSGGESVSAGTKKKGKVGRFVNRCISRLGASISTIFSVVTGVSVAVSFLLGLLPLPMKMTLLYLSISVLV